MKRFRKYIPFLLLSCIVLELFGCGGSDSTTANPTVLTASYKVEYIPITTATEGKSAVTIKLTNLNSGTPAAGRTVTLVPMMDMGTMSHSAPIDKLVDNGDGTYSSSIYYLMSGAWTLDVKIGGETATFSPTVASSTLLTPKATLKGITDQIAGMGGMGASRTYYLFNDGLSGGTFKLFIAALDDSMMMSFPAVSAGSILHDQAGAAWTVSAATTKVEVSPDNGVTWISAADKGNGHWEAVGISGTTVKVKLSVNGEQKTTDGLAVTPANTAASFTL